MVQEGAKEKESKGKGKGKRVAEETKFFLTARLQLETIETGPN